MSLIILFKLLWLMSIVGSSWKCNVIRFNEGKWRLINFSLGNLDFGNLGLGKTILVTHFG